jgi:hypothetical protein
MADPENITNVTPLHPTGDRIAADPRKRAAAERSRRYRQRKRQPPPVTLPVTPRDASVATDQAPPKRDVVTVTAPPAALCNTDTVTPGAVTGRRDGITVSTLTAALALAMVSAGFSITGMTTMFVGAPLPVIAMGIALEAGKLTAVAALPTLRWDLLKGALVALVAVLMGLNAIGAYGFLAKAHIGHELAGETAVAGRSADIEARIGVQQGVLGDLDRRLAQIDDAVETATRTGRTASAMALAVQQRKTRADLVAQRTNEAKALAGLQVEKASINGQRLLVEADLGPVRYLAMLLGADNETVLRWFILVVALLLDPAAVLLILVATRTRS